MDENVRYLLAIAEYGSISKAADAVHMSQSALSWRLKNEESQLGVELFDRTHLPLHSTLAGSIYLEWAQQAVRAEKTLRERLAMVTGGEQRVLSVGVSSSRFSGILSDAASRFCREMPGCQLNFIEAGRLEQLNEAFSSGRISCSILTPQVPEPTRYYSKPLCEERYVYIAPSFWDIPTKKNAGGSTVVDADTIAAYPFLMPAFAHRSVAIIESLFDYTPRRPVIRVSCVNPGMMYDLVEKGIGGSVANTSGSIGDAHPGIRSYEVEGITGRSFLYYSRPVDGLPGADETAFEQLIEDELRQRHLMLE